MTSDEYRPAITPRKVAHGLLLAGCCWLACGVFVAIVWLAVSRSL